jgi:hypothetical protein
MAHDCAWNLDAMVPLQAQAESQIDIFYVAEKPFIEAVGIPEAVGSDQARRSTG